MTTLIAILIVLALIVGSAKLFQHWLDSYMKSDFDEEQARRDVEELLASANKAPKRRAF